MELGDSAIERGDDLGLAVRVMAVVELLRGERPRVVNGHLDVARDAPFVDRAEVGPDECQFKPIEERLGRLELLTAAVSKAEYVRVTRPTPSQMPWSPLQFDPVVVAERRVIVDVESVVHRPGDPDVREI